jgi:hypothetical protein
LFNKKEIKSENEEKNQSGEVSRRDFLVGAGTVLAASTIGGGLLAGCKGETITETVQVTTTKTVPTTVQIPTTIVSTVQVKPISPGCLKSGTMKLMYWLLVMVVQVSGPL